MSGLTGYKLLLCNTGFPAQIS
ncbi:hypothetical protein S7711_11573, partial [Stachybotrys chartarum IBT 7711]